jgi:hypothetical protein
MSVSAYDRVDDRLVHLPVLYVSHEKKLDVFKTTDRRDAEASGWRVTFCLKVTMVGKNRSMLRR